MLDATDAARIADHYALGADAVLSGPVARGEVGQVWRLTTSLGSWAVKEPFEAPSVAEAIDDAAFQDVVAASGVCMPHVVRTGDGDVLVDVGSSTVRVYERVDLAQRDAWLDPASVGRIAASIHRVEYHGDNPVEPWYTDPMGAGRWDDVIRQSTDAGAAFSAQLAALRVELLALEELLGWPSNLQTCHRDLFAKTCCRRRRARCP